MASGYAWFLTLQLLLVVTRENSTAKQFLFCVGSKQGSILVYVIMVQAVAPKLAYRASAKGSLNLHFCVLC